MWSLRCVCRDGERGSLGAVSRVACELASAGVVGAGELERLIDETMTTPHSEWPTCGWRFPMEPLELSCPTLIGIFAKVKF
jgi:hypothetical protein